MRILILEGDTVTADELAAALRRDGHHVDRRQSLDDDCDRPWATDTHLVILDTDLVPEPRARDLLRAQCIWAATMVLVTTRCAGFWERVNALEDWVDDYLVKPVPTREVLARARALLRRHPLSVLSHGAGAVQVTDDLWLDLAARQLVGGTVEQPLTEREFRLLAYLVRHEGAVLGRDHILAAVWGSGYEASEREIDVYIRYLRQKVEPEPSRPKYILTARGRGYRFCRSRRSMT